MSTVFEISKWSEVFETAESRRHRALTWVSMPVSFMSSGYQSLLESFGEDSPAIYGAWCALVAFAAQCPTRGRLGNSHGRPITWLHVSRVTGFSVEVFERLVAWASKPSVGWLIVVETHENAEEIAENEIAQPLPRHCPGVSQANTGLPDLTRPNLTIHNKTIPSMSSEPAEPTSEPIEPTGTPDDVKAEAQRASHQRPGTTPTAEPPVLVFPCVGVGPKEWSLSRKKLAEWQEAYPAVSVLTECRKARQWCIDNPAKRKTSKGMNSFLSRWLSRQQDKSGSSHGATVRSGGDPRGTFATADAYLRSRGVPNDAD